MSGSLVCVGVGMMLGAHISPICRNHIEQADIVFLLMSDSFVESWVASMNDNTVSLQKYYREGKPRTDTYKEMVSTLVEAAKLGKKVVAAFYGHPGVFACVAHRAIEQVRKLDISASMEAGISAEDCLYADLGVDPGKTGCIHYEASQFMFYKRNIDTAAYLILWQVAFTGDQTYKRFSTSAQYVALLADLLKKNYPKDHEVILYEAKVLAIDSVRSEKITLDKLSMADLKMQTTLVIPPCSEMVMNDEVKFSLDELDRTVLKSKLTLVK